MAVLWNPTIPALALVLREAEVAARSLKVQLQVLEARAPSDFASAFSAMTKGRAGALIALGGPMFFAHRTRIVALAAKNRLPAVYGMREFVDAGGLMSYGLNIADNYRRAATYVDKILKGAKALGLTIPPSLLGRADELIE